MTYLKAIRLYPYIYLLFQTGIYIFTQNMTLTLVNQISFGQVVPSSTQLEMDLNNSTLVYSIGNQIYMYSVTIISNLTLLKTITFPTPID